MKPRCANSPLSPSSNEATARLKAAQQQSDRISGSGTRETFDLPLDLSGGTAFQRKVWRTLLNVPYAKLRSYQWVAARVGGPQYARAVGNAVGANPLPIVVPLPSDRGAGCHAGWILRRLADEAQTPHARRHAGATATRTDVIDEGRSSAGYERLG